MYLHTVLQMWFRPVLNTEIMEREYSNMMSVHMITLV